MNNVIFDFAEPVNEPILDYLPGSRERECLEKELSDQGSRVVEIPLIIGGKEIKPERQERLSILPITIRCWQHITWPLKRR